MQRSQVTNVTDPTYPGFSPESHPIQAWRNTPQDLVNNRIYHSPGISRYYKSFAPLDRAETMALLKYQSAFAGRDMLDVGIGTGRTSSYLAPLAGRYVGIDYSPQQVDYVRSNLPDIPVQLADMRDLSPFAAGSFDFVFASCNVVDAVSHDDRLETFREMRRVLRGGGVLMFSSHNRHYCQALSGPGLDYSKNPVTQSLYVAIYLRRLLNHARFRGLRRFEADYALLNDIGHDFAALHYYISRATQEIQLEKTGFRLIDVFDVNGRCLTEVDSDEFSPSLMYVAERIDTL